jgi:hypothetical protein
MEVQTMANHVFVAALAVGFALLFLWGFRALPHEEWQILASVPRERAGDDDWRGLNLTYYGLLTASATGLATAILFALLGAVGVPVTGSTAVAAGVLGVCVPAAKVVARMVERKSATFTVGGASFLGILIAPCVLWLTNALIGARLGVHVPVGAALAAILAAYALGEGAGRLACISFGCCYGRPVATSHPVCRTLFGTLHFTFTGRSKKAVYEGGLDREPVVPIQAITAVVYVASGLCGIWLFLRGAFLTAFLGVALVTHVWRALSETLRADYRGPGRISAYQIMAGVGALYAVVVSLVLPAPEAVRPDILAGLRTLWSPWFILLLQGLWVAIFLYTGRSMVTGATISIYVVKERI